MATQRPWGRQSSRETGAGSRRRPRALRTHGFKGEVHLLHLVRRLVWPDAHLRLHDGHRCLHTLQVLRLVGEAGEVGVGRVLFLGTNKGLDAGLVEVRRHLRAPGELLEEQRVPPGGVNAHLGGEHVGVALKAHLVVAPARRPVGEDRHLVLDHGPDETAAGDVPANAGRVPVATIVRRLRLDHVEASLGHVVLQVDDDRVHTARGHAHLHIVDVRLVRLAQVCGEGEHFDTRIDEALGDGLGVEATRYAHADELALQILVRGGGHICFPHRTWLLYKCAGNSGEFVNPSALRRPWRAGSAPPACAPHAGPPTHRQTALPQRQRSLWPLAACLRRR